MQQQHHEEPQPQPQPSSHNPYLMRAALSRHNVLPTPWGFEESVRHARFRPIRPAVPLPLTLLPSAEQRARNKERIDRVLQRASATQQFSAPSTPSAPPPSRHPTTTTPTTIANTPWTDETMTPATARLDHHGHDGSFLSPPSDAAGAAVDDGGWLQFLEAEAEEEAAPPAAAAEGSGADDGGWLQLLEEDAADGGWLSGMNDERARLDVDFVDASPAKPRRLLLPPPVRLGQAWGGGHHQQHHHYNYHHLHHHSMMLPEPVRLTTPTPTGEAKPSDGQEQQAATAWGGHFTPEQRAELERQWAWYQYYQQMQQVQGQQEHHHQQQQQQQAEATAAAFGGPR